MEESSLYARTEGPSQLACKAPGEDHQLICLAQQCLHYNLPVTRYLTLSPESTAREQRTFKHVCHLITSFCASKASSIPEPNISLFEHSRGVFVNIIFQNLGICKESSQMRSRSMMSSKLCTQVHSRRSVRVHTQD